MYYLDEIFDRTFGTWEDLMHVESSYSLWGESMEIEAKPNDWTHSAAATENWGTVMKTEDWNDKPESDSGADSSEWSEESDSNSKSESWSPSDETPTEWGTDSEVEADSYAEVVTEIKDAVASTMEEIDPFSSDEDSD